MSTNRGGVGHDYRREYLKKNKGMLGTGIYICPYCGLPGLLKNSHIDHIMPKSKSEHIFNRQYNLIATHGKCNQKKSDKVDHRVIQGYTAKVFGGVIGGFFNIIINIIVIPLGFVPRIISTFFNLLQLILSVLFKTVTSTLTGTFAMIFSILFKPIIVIVLIGLMMLYFN